MRLYLIPVLFFFFLPAAAQDFREYKKLEFVRAEKHLPYRLLYPLNYDSSKKYPLLVFLHGSLGKGTDNEAQLHVGARFFLADSNRLNFPAFILFPQCPLDDSWAYFENEIDPATSRASHWKFPFKKEPTPVVGLLKLLLDSLINVATIDQKKIYIGGLSQGGMGVYDMIARYPGLFTASFAICGAGKSTTADKFASHTAIWIFHGEDDQVVPVYFSQDFYRKLKKLGADVQYTEYENTGHNSWGKAFSEPGLLRWIFSKSK